MPQPWVYENVEGPTKDPGTHATIINAEGGSVPFTITLQNATEFGGLVHSSAFTPPGTTAKAIDIANRIIEGGQWHVYGPYHVAGGTSLLATLTSATGDDLCEGVRVEGLVPARLLDRWGSAPGKFQNGRTPSEEGGVTPPLGPPPPNPTPLAPQK